MADEQIEQPAESHPPAPAASKTIKDALIEAAKYAKAVAKSSRNEYHQYNYASSEAIIEEAREALLLAGLMIFQKTWRIENPLPGAPGIVGSYQVAVVTYEWIHAHSEERREVEVPYYIIPEKGRPQDKALSAALTYNFGYYLRGVLMLPRVDADVDAGDDRGHDPNRQNNQQKQQKQQRQQNQQQNNQQNGQQNGQNQNAPDKISEGIARVRTTDDPQHCLDAMKALDKCGTRAGEVSTVASGRMFQLIHKMYKTAQNSKDIEIIDSWRQAAEWKWNEQQIKELNKTADMTMTRLSQKQ